MLRIVPTTSAAGAKKYYSHSDYYTEDQELAGVWRGQGAERLGLAGIVEKAQFDALCDNLHPRTGESITPRNRTDRTVGYDFNFHAPKSVSLIFSLTNNGEILKAFQDSVDETMQLIEADAQTRVRKGKAYEDRTTGELVWSRFDHMTSRPVDGIPDPHLHSHAFVFNATFDSVEDRWKAGQFRALKRDAPFYQAVFHSKLAARVSALGYPVEKTPGGWDVKGIARSTLEKFSRRTLRIEALAQELGIESPAGKAALGATTREGKAKNLNMVELRRLWADRLDGDERRALADLPGRAVGGIETGVGARDALDYACRHLFERNSVVAERKLAAEMLDAGLGRFSLDEAREAIAHSDVIVRDVNGQRLATTRAVLAEEERLIAFARDGRGRCAPLGSAEYAVEREWLNAGQQAAVRHVLTSPDRVMVIRGAAGAGKTSLMEEAVAAIEQGGKKVFAFAPSAEASRGVLRREGFGNAETLARLLLDTKLQEETRGQVLWIDEAGLVSSNSMRRLFDLAERNGNRVILSGDRKQHGSVERGAVLRILESQAGIVSAEVKEIQRQKGSYKKAVEHLSEGRTQEGFDALDALGWVKEVADEDRYRQLAADYVSAVRESRSALVVSPTHAEGALVTSTIREALRADGRLGGEERRFAALTRVDLTEAERGRAENYRPGDVLQFHQHAKGGHRSGSRLVVAEGVELPLDRAARFQVFRPGQLGVAQGDRVRITHGGQSKDGHKLENGAFYEVAGFTRGGDLRLNNGWVVGRDFGHLAHGYVSTSFAAQGKTVDRVIIGQSSRSLGATSTAQFYVSASRGRQQVTVYTDDKAALREAIAQSDERMTATELLGRKRGEDRSRLRLLLNRTATRDRQPIPAPARGDRERKEVGRRG